MADEQQSDGTERVIFGLEENVAGALCYALWFVTGIIFYLLEEDNKFVRFHALQSTIALGAVFIVSRVVAMMAIGWFFIASLFAQLISLLGIILWVVLMVKAYQGEKYKLPVVGDWAEDYV